jgi:hypothetical protein
LTHAFFSASRKRNFEIFADLPSEEVVDFAMTGYGGRFARLAVDVHRVAASLSEKYTAVLFEVAN